MQLEAGKRYVDRRGRVFGPITGGPKVFGEGGSTKIWWADGMFSTYEKTDIDLVAEYVEPVPESTDEWVEITDPNHVLRDTDEANAELNLRHGSTIQGGGGWHSCRELRIVGDTPAPDLLRYRCRKSDLPKSEPAAECNVNPDMDWVVQDRVPARIGIDQFRYPDAKTKSIQDWGDVTAGGYWDSRGVHGWIDQEDGSCGRLELRCRRKDLPVVAHEHAVEKKQAVDPGEGYRLLGEDELVIEGDEFWGNTSNQWLMSSNYPGRQSDFTYRRKIEVKPATRSIVFKECACWNNRKPDARVIIWQTDAMVKADEHGGFDNEVPTGNERIIELPI